jgi:hypothetical protein
MTVRAELKAESYQASVSLLLDKPPVFDVETASSHREIYRHSGQSGNVWVPFKTSGFFPDSRATIEGDTITELHQSTIGPGDRDEGIYVDGNGKSARINVFQSYREGKSIGTTAVVQDLARAEESMGQLFIEHHAEKLEQKPDLQISDDVELHMETGGLRFLSESGIFPITNWRVGWRIKWNFKSSSWYIENGEERIPHQLQPEQVELLRENGFNLPTRIEKNAVGVRAELRVNGNDVRIEVPSAMPHDNVADAFIEGFPVVPLSIQVNNQERVDQTTDADAKKWRESLQNVRVTQDERKGMKLDTERRRGNFPFYHVPSPLFADSRVHLNLTEEDERGAPVVFMFQELVWHGSTNNEKAGMDVKLLHHTRDLDGLTQAQFILRRDNGLSFVLESVMESQSRHFQHTLKMQFSEHDVEMLKKQSEFLTHLFGSDKKLRNRLDLIWSSEKRRFVFREYTDEVPRKTKKETDCPMDVIENIMGFKFDLQALKIDGATARVAIAADNAEYIVTIPTSLDARNTAEAVKTGKPFIPMAVYTKSTGEWVNVLQ